MIHIHACLCGHEQRMEAEEMRYGCVVQCVGCKKVWTRVRPHRGGDAWIAVNDKDVAFHRLIGEVENDDDI